MLLNFLLVNLATLCVGFILGWIVGRPRRWGSFGSAGGPGAAGGEDPTDANPLARRA